MTNREEFFWAKVAKSDGCWEWTGSIQKKTGYGQFSVNRKCVSAHRYAYLTFVGLVDEGNVVDHMCRNRACVRPDHLQQVTRQQNNENRVGWARSFSGVRGVSWSKSRKAWLVHVTHDYRYHHGGYFASLAEAEKAAIALRQTLMSNSISDGVALGWTRAA